MSTVINAQDIDTVKDTKNEIIHLVTTFCFSNMIFEERYKKAMKHTRKNVIVSDTDSVFVTFLNYVNKTVDILGLETSAD